LKSLIYVSKANQGFNEVELTRVVSRFTQDNKNEGVTGFLFYQNNLFFQYLEGNSNSLSQLFTKIAHDDRHTLVSTLLSDKEQKPRFADWPMKYLDDNHIALQDMKMLLMLMQEQSEHSPCWQELVWEKLDYLAENVHAII